MEKTHLPNRKIGFIGLGKMGGGFSRHLMSKGHDLNLFDTDPRTLKGFEDTTGKLCTTVAECVLDADFVFTSLPTPKIVKDVYLGNNGIMNSIKKNCVLIDLSTIDPITSMEIENKAISIGQKYLAVTIGKGPIQAANGESPLFVGGSQDAYEMTKDILSDMGQTYSFGTVEKCISFKLITNLIGMVNLAALAEGFALARECGIDPEMFKKAMDGTGAKSYQQEIRLDMLINSDFTEKFALQYTVKDLGLANDIAKEKGFPLFISPVVYNIYQSVKRDGFGKLDSAAIIKFYERGD